MLKKSKAEVISTMVGSYLERRHFMAGESFQKFEFPPNITKEQFAVQVAAEKEASRTNSIVFSSVNHDVFLIDQQFSRLQSWVSEVKPDACRNELAALLCPFFCHLYLELLRAGHRQSVAKFFKRHQALFACREISRSLVEELSCIYNYQEVDSSPTVKAFRSCKYRVHLSSFSMNCLQNYLSKHGHVLFLQVLKKWFDFQISNTTLKHMEEEEEKDMSSEVKVKEQDECAATSDSQDDKLKNLQALIKAVRSFPSASATHLTLYNICHTDRVNSTYLTSDINMLAAAEDAKIFLWNLRQNKPQYFTESGGAKMLKLTQKHSYTTLYGHKSDVNDFAQVQNELLLSVAEDMHCWRLSDFSAVAVYKGHNHPIWSVDVDTLGFQIATGSHDRTARLWNLDRTYPLRIFSGHLQDVEVVKFHPNSNYVATGSTDKTIRLFSVSDAAVVRVLGGHRGGVQALAFSPDGKYIASGGEDKRVRIWNLADSRVVLEFRGHTQTVTDIVWNKDGETVASSSMDGTVWLWNVQKRLGSASGGVFTGQENLGYNTGSNPVSSLRYSKRGLLNAVIINRKVPRPSNMASTTHSASSQPS